MDATLGIEAPTELFLIDRARRAGGPRERSLRTAQRSQSPGLPPRTESGRLAVVEKLGEKQPASTRGKVRSRLKEIAFWFLLLFLALSLTAVVRLLSQDGSLDLSRRLNSAKEEIHDIGRSLRSRPQAGPLCRPFSELENAFSENAQAFQDLGSYFRRELAPRLKLALKTGNCGRVHGVLSSAQSSARQSTATLRQSLAVLNHTLLPVETAQASAQEASTRSTGKIADMSGEFLLSYNQEYLHELDETRGQAEGWLTQVSTVVAKLNNMRARIWSEIERCDRFADGLQILMDKMGTERPTTAEDQGGGIYCGAYRAESLDRWFWRHIEELAEDVEEESAFSDGRRPL